MKRKVFHLVTTLDADDVGKHLWTLLAHIDRRRWDVSVGCLEGEGAWAGRFRDIEVPVRDFRRRAAFRTLALSRLRSHLRALSPDVVHVHLTRASSRVHIRALAAAPRAGVATLHGPVRFRSVRQLRAALGGADAVITVSHEAARQIERTGALPPGKIHCIPYGLDLQEFDRESRPTELRRALGLPREVRLILSVVRRASVARVRHLVLAAESLSHRFPQFVLLLVGLAPSAGRRLRRLVARLHLTHTVLTTGLRDDLSAVTKEADILVATSGEDESAYGVLEGLAAGIPVVAAREAPEAEVLLDEATGLLYEPDTSEALAGSLARLLAAPELARLMGSTARTRVETDFSAQRMVDAVETVYDDVLSRQAERSP